MLARIKINRVISFRLSCWLHLQNLFELASGVSIFAWAAAPDFALNLFKINDFEGSCSSTLSEFTKFFDFACLHARPIAFVKVERIS